MAQPKNPTAKRPDDKPFDYNLDTVQAEVDLRPFVVQYQGRRWEFAHLQNLNIMPLIAAAQHGDAAAVVGTFREALGEQQWRDFEKAGLPQYKAQKLFDAYQEHCGLQPGESPASSTS